MLGTRIPRTMALVTQTLALEYLSLGVFRVSLPDTSTQRTHHRGANLHAKFSAGASVLIKRTQDVNRAGPGLGSIFKRDTHIKWIVAICQW
jgi:hypothetical protein